MRGEVEKSMGAGPADAVESTILTPNSAAGKIGGR